MIRAVGGATDCPKTVLGSGTVLGRSEQFLDVLRIKNWGGGAMGGGRTLFFIHLCFCSRNNPPLLGFYPRGNGGGARGTKTELVRTAQLLLEPCVTTVVTAGLGH